MIDLAIITAVLAQKRVADQFARHAVTETAPRRATRPKA